LKRRQEPILLIVRAVEREVARFRIREIDCMAADDDKMFESFVLGWWNHMIWMCESWILHCFHLFLAMPVNCSLV
jgi:hypothetical protein